MDQQELINAYLRDKLSPEDKKLFEQLVAENPAYAAELELQRRRLGTNEDSPNPVHWIRSWLIPTGIAFVIVLIGYFLWVNVNLTAGDKLYKSYFTLYPVPEQPDTYGDLAVQAFEAYEKGEFDKAIGLFEGLQAQPDSDYALLYLGICQLQTGRPERAIPTLDFISPKSIQAPAPVVAWYIALGHMKMNKLENARTYLEKTVATENPFQSDAGKILSKLD